MLPKIRDLYDNQTAILCWLHSLGHEIDDADFWELLDAEQYEYSAKRVVGD